MKKARTVRFTIFSVFLLVCWCLLLSPAVILAEESDVQVQPAASDTKFASAWPMYMHDPQHSGRSEYRGPVTDIEVKWKIQHSWPADFKYLGLAVNGDLYALTESNNVIVFDHQSGDIQKQFITIVKGAPITLNNNVVAIDGSKSVYALWDAYYYDWIFTFEGEDYKDDMKTAPVVVSNNGESIYIHAPDGQLFALDARNGHEKWRTEIYADNTPAIGSDGTIYTISATDRSEPSYLYAVNPDSGAVKWKLQISNKNVGECNLAVADDGTIYISTQDNLYAVTSSGEMQWQMQVADRLTAPAIGKDVLYVGTGEGVLYAINFDGTVKWKCETDDTIYLPPIIDSYGTVYVCSGNKLYALEPFSGDVLFRYILQERITAGPIIDQKSTLYIAAKNRVIALYSTAPYAPYQLTAQIGDFNSIKLTWQQAAGPKADGFIIEQRIGDLEYRKIGETGRGIAQFELNELPSGIYSYRVKAFNKGGQSLYSNEVTVDLRDAKDVHTARFYLNSTTYYKDSSAYLMDVAPTIIENRTFLPVRYVADALGAEIQWLGTENRVNIVRGENRISLWIDQPQATVNGNLHFIDPQNHKVRPTLLPPGRTMLPIRFIAESLDCQVEWNEQTKEVKIVYVK